MKGRIRRQYKSLLIGGIGLLGEERVEDRNEAGEEVVSRDEIGAHAWNREDLYTKGDDGIFGLSICKEVGFRYIRVDLSKMNTWKNRKV